MNFDPEVQKKFFNKLTNNNVTLERIKDNKYSITKLNELLNRSRKTLKKTSNKTSNE